MSRRWRVLREAGCKTGCRAIATACGSSMFVQAINTRGIGGESGERQVLCPSLSKHQQTSASQRVEFAPGVAARSAESDLPAQASDGANARFVASGVTKRLQLAAQVMG